MEGQVSSFNKEELLQEFFKETLKILQKDTRGTNEFVKEAATCMLFGYEFDSEFLREFKNYELLLMCNLSYNNYSEYEDSESFLDNIYNITAPFDRIDDNYYRNLLIENPLLLLNLTMMIKATSKLDQKDFYTIALINMRNKNFLNSYDSFGKLQDIIRKGWLIRNVSDNYLENDSAHIMQMCALASACFNIYNLDNLDKQKVFEMILIHEIGEIVAGDIAEVDPKHQNKHDIEKIGVIETFSPLKSGEHFIFLWEEFEERKTEEAKFVYELDKIDPILKAAFLDQELGRDDLTDDFYSYEEKRKTFENGKLKSLFKSMKKTY